MGARVYIPGLGRFLSVDPVQGGTPNNYVYPTDSVNDFDLDGNIGWKKWFTDHSDIAITAVGVAGCAATAGTGCAIIGAAVLASNATIAYAQGGKAAATKSAGFDAVTMGIGNKIKLVRDFGKVAGQTRYYKSAASAFFRKDGFNQQALKRLGLQSAYAGATTLAQKGYSKLKAGYQRRQQIKRVNHRLDFVGRV